MPHPNQVAQLPLSAEFPLWGPQTLTHTHKAQEGQDSEMQNCCVTHIPTCMSATKALRHPGDEPAPGPVPGPALLLCAAAVERKHANEEPQDFDISP